jgi:hypothetical protein
LDLRAALKLVAGAGLVVAILAVGAAPAHGAPERVAVSTAAEAPRAPASLPGRPTGFALSAREAIELADRQDVVAEQTERYGRLTTAIAIKDGNAWQVGYSAGGVERAQVFVDGPSGEVREAWTGHQVAWPLARGYEGQFGHVLNSPWVWIPLCALFFFGLFDWRQPWRIVHLDLLVLLGFGVSHFFLNRGEIGLSVPLAYPPLLYLLARMLWLGFRGGEPLRPRVRARWLAVAVVALLAFRLTINVADSGVIDVGYAGAVGADRIAHGQPLYGEGVFPQDNGFGDTYGPVNYYAYVPFELALPWSGEWDELPSAHAAAIAFDLATICGLVVFGLRLRPGAAGRALAATLAFAWVAYPYTAFTLQSNSNDTLIAALLAWSLALFARPIARGAMLGLAGLAKFAPLILVPLFAAGERGLGRTGLRPVLWFSAGFAVVAVLALAHPAIDPGLATFWERTLQSQLDRESPFSIWGQTDLDWLKTVLAVGVGALAVALAFAPRRRGIAQIAALAAALVIALELVVEHWFYLYIPWFAPALLIALAIAAPRARAELAKPATG